MDCTIVSGVLSAVLSGRNLYTILLRHTQMSSTSPFNAGLTNVLGHLRHSGWHSHISRKHPGSNPPLPSPIEPSENSAVCTSMPDVLESTPDVDVQRLTDQSSSNELDQSSSNAHFLLEQSSYTSVEIDNCLSQIENPYQGDNNVSRSAAFFLLSIKEKHRLTQTC